MLPYHLRRARLLFGLLVALTFFGCVGMPQRRLPKKEKKRPTLPERLPADKKMPDLDLDLRIPEEPKPTPPQPPKKLPDLTGSPVPRLPESLNKDIVPVKKTNELPPPPTPTVPESPVKKPGPLPILPPSPYDSKPTSWKKSTSSKIQLPSKADPLLAFYSRVKQNYDRVGSYIARMTRKEMVNGKMQPEEVMLFKFRKKPWSVYFKWLGKNGKGREVVFVEWNYDNRMHGRRAKGDILLMPAGKRMSFSPDSFLVRRNSRHSIRHAGVGRMVKQIGDVLARQSNRDFSKGSVVYHGKKTRSDLPGPVECVEWRLPPGLEKELPRGGKRWCFVDLRVGLPTLILTEDDKGKMVEYYRYDRFQFPVRLDERDFNPDVLWEK